MLLVWVAAIPPSAAVETPYKRFLRVLLPMVAVAEALQVYPVAGSQLGIASAFFVAVGALCLGDAWTDICRLERGPRRATSGPTSQPRWRWSRSPCPRPSASTRSSCPGISGAFTYHELTKLKLPGAELMHLGAAQDEEYEAVVELLHKHHCTTFVGWPSVNSLYFWSGLEAPKPTIPNGWFYAMKESQQQLAVAELRASPRPCAIVNEELAELYIPPNSAPSTPLVHYVKQNFEPIEIVGGFTFELPKPSATEPGP